MTTVNVNEIALGIESFGDDDAPLVLLAGGTTMLSWPDALCERLAMRRAPCGALRPTRQRGVDDDGSAGARLHPPRPRRRRGGPC